MFLGLGDVQTTKRKSDEARRESKCATGEEEETIVFCGCPEDRENLFLSWYRCVEEDCKEMLLLLLLLLLLRMIEREMPRNPTFQSPQRALYMYRACTQLTHASRKTASPPTCVSRKGRMHLVSTARRRAWYNGHRRDAQIVVDWPVA